MYVLMSFRLAVGIGKTRLFTFMCGITDLKLPFPAILPADKCMEINFHGINNEASDCNRK